MCVGYHDRERRRSGLVVECSNTANNTNTPSTRNNTTSVQLRDNDVRGLVNISDEEEEEKEKEMEEVEETVVGVVNEVDEHALCFTLVVVLVVCLGEQDKVCPQA